MTNTFIVTNALKISALKMYHFVFLIDPLVELYTLRKLMELGIFVSHALENIIMLFVSSNL